MSMEPFYSIYSRYYQSNIDAIRLTGKPFSCPSFNKKKGASRVKSFFDDYSVA